MSTQTHRAKIMTAEATTAEATAAAASIKRPNATGSLNGHLKHLLPKGSSNEHPEASGRVARTSTQTHQATMTATTTATTAEATAATPETAAKRKTTAPNNNKGHTTVSGAAGQPRAQAQRRPKKILAIPDKDEK